MKAQILFLLVICLSACASQSIAVKKWFPDDIIYPVAIKEYTNNFSTNDLNVAREAYITLLVFIDEMVFAHYENFARSYRLDTPSVKRPAMINEKLTIIECTDVISILAIWDDVLEKYVEAGHTGDVVFEFIQIAHLNFLYNKFLNYCFSLTGEQLGIYKDEDGVWEKLWKDYKHLLER